MDLDRPPPPAQLLPQERFRHLHLPVRAQVRDLLQAVPPQMLEEDRPSVRGSDEDGGVGSGERGDGVGQEGLGRAVVEGVGREQQVEGAALTVQRGDLCGIALRPNPGQLSPQLGGQGAG